MALVIFEPKVGTDGFPNLTNCPWYRCPGINFLTPIGPDSDLLLHIWYGRWFSVTCSAVANFGLLLVMGFSSIVS